MSETGLQQWRLAKQRPLVELLIAFTPRVATPAGNGDSSPSGHYSISADYSGCTTAGRLLCIACH